MEEYNAPKFSITPIYNKETGEYSLQHFDEVKAVCEGFIEENSIEVITSSDDYKIVKKCRTNIRKKLETISSVRKSLVKLFSYQFIELEKMLKEADEKLKSLKIDYETSTTEEEPIDDDLKKTTLIIEYRDSKVIEQLKKIAVESGCKVTEVKEG